MTDVFIFPDNYAGEDFVSTAIAASLQKYGFRIVSSQLNRDNNFENYKFSQVMIFVLNDFINVDITEKPQLHLLCEYLQNQNKILDLAVFWLRMIDDNATLPYIHSLERFQFTETGLNEMTNLKSFRLELQGLAFDLRKAIERELRIDWSKNS